MIDIGHGGPILMIPGIQGRWEWMRPAIRELSKTHRVLSFSLSEVPADADCFSRWEAYVDELLDWTGIERVAVVGISFGGLIATRYAARRPHRVSNLILVSTPAPTWQLDRDRAGYLERPLRSAPAFAIGAIGRLLPEVVSAVPGRWRRVACLSGHLSRVIRFPASPRKMAAWTRAWQTSLEPDLCAKVTQPTLIVTGESNLDRVVPTSSTLQYLKLIGGSRHVTVPKTGHIGLISASKEFAAVVREFIERSHLTR